MSHNTAPLVEPIGAPKFAGTTWADFKQAVEACGVRDHDVIDSIEWRIAKFGSGRIVTASGDDGIEIREL